MRFVVGLAAGAALAVAAYVYAQRNDNLRAALDGIEADLRAGDTDALRARLEAGLDEARTQVRQRVGESGDWAADALVTEPDAVVTPEAPGEAPAPTVADAQAPVDAPAPADPVTPETNEA
jgi:hypothetical protein